MASADPDQTSVPSNLNSHTIKEAAGAYVGGAIGGSFLGGIPFGDMATSLQGAPGVLVGYFAGILVAPVLFPGDPNSADYAGFAPFAGAVIVPLLAGGTVDRALFGLLIGAKIGAMLV